MPSLFDEIESASQAAITTVFGDGIRIRPMKAAGNYGGGADPDRPVVETVGTIGTAPNTAEADYPGTRSDGAPAALSPSEIWLDRAVVAAIPYDLKRGDVIETISSPVRRFVVATAERGDNGDMRIVLAK